MKKNLLIAFMLVFANICFAQTQSINLSGMLYDCKGEKPRFQGFITAEWRVVEYLGQKNTILYFPNPEGENGWGDIIPAGGVWEIITDPDKIFSGSNTDENFVFQKSFLVYDPIKHDSAILVEWLRNKKKDNKEVWIKLCRCEKINNKYSYKPHHALVITENANTVFATTIMDLLNYAVRRGILTEKIIK